MKAPGKQTNRDPLLSRWLQRQTLSADEQPCSSYLSNNRLGSWLYCATG